MNYLIVMKSGQMKVETRVESIPSQMAQGGCRCFALDAGEDLVPFIGGEVTIGEGDVKAQIRLHSVTLDGEEIGTGQSKTATTLDASAAEIPDDVPR